MGKFIDLAGQQFNRLTVIERAGYRGKNIVWLCRCECGNQTKVTGTHLKTGHTKSCGCLVVEVSRENGKSRATHGMKRTRLYHVWRDIKIRCFNHNSSNFPIYGGRGITMCEEWRSSFESFRNWAVANGYDDNAPFGQCTIDRIDVNGNYEPTNCRWITNEKQSNNRRNNRIIEIHGETHTASEWAKIYGVDYHTFHARLQRGWNPERALTETIKGGKTK